MMGAVNDRLVGVVLSAGEGRRLRPLTSERPKVLAPLASRPLLWWAVRRFAGVLDEVVVNVHAHAEMIEDWLAFTADHGVDAPGPDGPWWRRSRSRAAPSAHELSTIVGAGLPRLVVSREGPEALGTAGALAALRDHLGGRGVLAVNGDTWTDVDLAALVDAWDGIRPLVAHEGAEFRPGVAIAASITPSLVIEGLAPTPSGLYGHVWRPAAAAGSLQTVSVDAVVRDCGTPARYLAANLELSTSRLVVESGDDVSERTGGPAVVWSGAPERRLPSGAILSTRGRMVIVRDR